jgi:hypothetical protein
VSDPPSASAADPRDPLDPRDRFIEAEIRNQLGALTRDNASIDPAAIARALDPDQWKRWMQPVREVARRMAQRGAIETVRHGRPTTEWPWRGVVRLRNPRVPTSGSEPEPPPDA